MINRVLPAGLVERLEATLDPKFNKKLLALGEEIRYNSRIEKQTEQRILEICRKSLTS
jgi:hypothetical protein